jgi:uncharacterized protein GlcG (DUF336 family)
MRLSEEAHGGECLGRVDICQCRIRSRFFTIPVKLNNHVRLALGKSPVFGPGTTLRPQIERTPMMDLLAFAKNVAERVEAEASRTQIPVAVCVIDTHGNIVLHHRMNGAPAFAIELSERKAYTSALVRMRTTDLLPLVQPGCPLFPLMSQGRYCAMGGGAPLASDGEVVAGVGISGGTVEEDVAILEAAIREA